MIVLCPYCSHTLYETARIEGPFNTFVGKKPRIQPEGEEMFIICEGCQQKVYLIQAGTGYRVSPIPKK